MSNNQMVVLGSTSAIATRLLPTLDFHQTKILAFDRLESAHHLGKYIPIENQYRCNWDKASEVETFISMILTERISHPVLVLNFMGSFGQIKRIDELDIDSVLLTNSINLMPFFLAAKISKCLPAGSKIISFSGAGVGGNNLDDSSFGYLAAKASMAVTIESIDQQLSKHGVRYGLIAPGAFPSKMQEAVAKDLSGSIPAGRVARAKEVIESNPSITKLGRLVHFLSENPEMLGGRTWSANFDELTEHPGNFGRLRRIY